MGFLTILNVSTALLWRRPFFPDFSCTDVFFFSPAEYTADFPLPSSDPKISVHLPEPKDGDKQADEGVRAPALSFVNSQEEQP